MISFLMLAALLPAQMQPIEWEHEYSFSDRPVVANESAHIHVKVINSQTQTVPHHYMVMHGKKMHMIIVKDDLTEFAHIHPHLMTSRHHGHGHHHQADPRFHIEINSPSSDPDNFMTEVVTPSPGRYFMFVESMPHMMPMSMAMGRTEFEVVGEDNGPQKKIDYRPHHEIQTKYFDENSQPAQEGAKYKVEFEVEQVQFCSIWMPRFYFSVHERSAGGVYERAKGFNPWLTMGGHVVMISADQENLGERQFHHMHAFLPMAIEGEFTFPYHDHQNPLPSGRYRLWGQMKQGDQVLSFPFAIDYKNPLFDEHGNPIVRPSGC